MLAAGGNSGRRFCRGWFDLNHRPFSSVMQARLKKVMQNDEEVGRVSAATPPVTVLALG